MVIFFAANYKKAGALRKKKKCGIMESLQKVAGKKVSVDCEKNSVSSRRVLHELLDACFNVYGMLCYHGVGHVSRASLIKLLDTGSMGEYTDSERIDSTLDTGVDAYCDTDVHDQRIVFYLNKNLKNELKYEHSFSEFTEFMNEELPAALEKYKKALESEKSV